MNQSRTPKGQPTGGQFAAKSNPEPDVELAEAPGDTVIDGISYAVQSIAHRPGCRAYRLDGADGGWAFEYDPSTRTAVASAIRPLHPSPEWLDNGDANITHVVGAVEPDALFVDLRGAGAGTYAIGGPSWAIDPERYTGPFSASPPERSAPDGDAHRRIFPAGETQRQERGHAFLTNEIIEKTPALYDTDGVPFKDKVVTAHYFSAAGDWHVTELDPDTGEFFGCCDLGMGFPEWGYENLKSLEAVKDRRGRPAVERDVDFRAQTAGELRLAHTGD